MTRKIIISFALRAERIENPESLLIILIEIASPELQNSLSTVAPPLAGFTMGHDPGLLKEYGACLALILDLVIC